MSLESALHQFQMITGSQILRKAKASLFRPSSPALSPPIFVCMSGGKSAFNENSYNNPLI